MMDTAHWLSLDFIRQLGVSQPAWFFGALLAAVFLLKMPSRSVLPGDWSTVIAKPLQAWLATRMPAPRIAIERLLLVLAWLMLAAALAGVNYGQAQAPNIRNLQGRVVVIDMGLGAGSQQLVQVARRFIARSPEVPSAVVAVRSEAFDVVPITTDHAHLDRYLRVLSDEVMPVPGRAPLMGIGRAQAILKRAKMHVGQIVLFSSDLPASGTQPARPNPAFDVWFVLPESMHSAWATVARQSDARVVRPSQLHTVGEHLQQRRDAAASQLASVRERRDLTALFVAAALLLWLWLFFRATPR